MTDSTDKCSTLFVPGDLDFFHSLVGRAPSSPSLLPGLKKHTLMCGQMVLPMEFLLFNTHLASLWKDDGPNRAQLDDFLCNADLVVTRARKQDLREFVPRLDAARRAGNPAALECITPNYAEYLDRKTSGTATTTLEFDSLNQLNRYPNLFLDEIDRLSDLHEIPHETKDVLVEEVNTLTRKYAPNKPIVDGTNALSRGGLTRVLRYTDLPLLRRLGDMIANCAHHAYLRNVSNTLGNAQRDIQAVLYSDAQVDRAVAIDLEERGFLDNLLRVTVARPFNIDWLSISRQPWTDIRETINTTPAKAYFAARSTLLQQGREQDLEPFLVSLDAYLRELESRYGNPAFPPKSVIQITEIGACVMIAITTFLTKQESHTWKLPVVWALGRWLVKSWNDRRESAKQNDQQLLRFDRLRGIAVRQYHNDRQELSSPTA